MLGLFSQKEGDMRSPVTQTPRVSPDKLSQMLTQDSKPRDNMAHSGPQNGPRTYKGKREIFSLLHHIINQFFRNNFSPIFNVSLTQFGGRESILRKKTNKTFNFSFSDYLPDSSTLIPSVSLILSVSIKGKPYPLNLWREIHLSVPLTLFN